MFFYCFSLTRPKAPQGRPQAPNRYHKGTNRVAFLMASGCFLILFFSRPSTATKNNQAKKNSIVATHFNTLSIPLVFCFQGRVRGEANLRLEAQRVRRKEKNQEGGREERRVGREEGCSTRSSQWVGGLCTGCRGGWCAGGGDQMGPRLPWRPDPAFRAQYPPPPPTSFGVASLILRKLRPWILSLCICI